MDYPMLSLWTRAPAPGIGFIQLMIICCGDIGFTNHPQVPLTRPVFYNFFLYICVYVIGGPREGTSRVVTTLRVVGSGQ